MEIILCGVVAVSGQERERERLGRSRFAIDREKSHSSGTTIRWGCFNSAKK